MGKATRWLKSLMGMKKEKETPTPPKENERKEKRRWSFTQQRNDSVQRLRRISLNIPATDASTRDAAWLQSYLSEEQDDKHAIAVAAATATAADAAVAAAQAAMAVVRLTANGKYAGAGRERSAAIKIQTFFKGYLARKALRALKGLVKLQAHVRGYLVRKRATATLRSMQALVRAQAAARLHRRSIGHDGSTKLPLETQARIYVERFEESRGEFHSKRMSAANDSSYDDNPKIVEIDTYKPKSRPSLKPNYYYHSEYNDQDNISHLQYSTTSGPIPGPFLTPARLSVPSRYECGAHDNEDRQFRHRRTSTAHSTPRFANMNWAHNGPFTPTKSVCGGDCDVGPFGEYRAHHRLSGSYQRNYMASTQSFEAKLRSQSAPKQRPIHPSPSKKRLPLEKLMESRYSLSSVKMHRSYSEDREAPHF